MFFFNPIYLIFVGPAILLMLYAQWRVQSAYSTWSKVPNNRRMTGLDAAQSLLKEQGLYNVQIQGVAGNLTDYYDPRSKTLNFSQSSAMSNSLASLAIFAHEIGHAQQDAAGDFMLKLRGGLVPAVNIGSNLGPILFFIGILLQFQPLMWLGIGFFALAFTFALVTLPVEFDASNRAMHMLTSAGFLVGQEEQRGARAVLNAAALTYVAALLMALMQLLYYVFMASSGGRRRR
jgi:Zn-dependent membrane protease YugP